MFDNLIALPAYGRTYSSDEELIESWDAGEDFVMLNGPYFSIRDVDTLKREHHQGILFSYRVTNKPNIGRFVLDFEK